jgi:hypothetical protein
MENMEPEFKLDSHEPPNNYDEIPQHLNLYNFQL